MLVIKSLATSTDLNSLTTQGLHRVTTPVNGNSVSAALVWNFTPASGDISQQLINMATGESHYRAKPSGGAFSAWTTLGAGGGGGGGNTILNGSGAPGGGTGANGDFYIDTTAWDIYGPKTAGAWGSGTSLVGPAGGGGGGSSLKKDQYSPPSAATFSTLVQTNSTNPNLSDVTDVGMTLGSGVSLAGGDNCRGAFKSIAAGSGAFTATCRIQACAIPMNYSNVGICLRESATGKMTQFGYNTGSMAIVNWSSPTSLNGTSWITEERRPGTDIEWFKIYFDGTDYNFYVSCDSQNWVLVKTVSKTTFFTAQANQIGFAVHVAKSGAWMTLSSGDYIYMNVLYWTEV